jgi:SAM-dependent methyltransferase
LGTVAPRSAEQGFSGGGELHECPDCGLLFLKSSVAHGDLDQLYAQLPVDAWDEIFGRADFDLAKEEIAGGKPAIKVLDIGCYRGDLLSLLPQSFEKFGIEPAQSARRVAEQRGIKIVGVSIDTAIVDEGFFDVLVLMDVIEHLPDPFGSLKKISRWLAPGGRIIVSTGNSDALPWRLVRLNYWYYHPEHISFCNRRWFQWAAERLGLTVTRSAKFSHSRRAYGKRFVPERWRYFAKCVASWTLARCGVKQPRYMARGDSTWPDHLFVVLTSPKNPAATAAQGK